MPKGERAQLTMGFMFIVHISSPKVMLYSKAPPSYHRSLHTGEALSTHSNPTHPLGMFLP